MNNKVADEKDEQSSAGKDEDTHEHATFASTFRKMIWTHHLLLGWRTRRLPSGVPGYPPNVLAFKQQRCPA